MDKIRYLLDCELCEEGDSIGHIHCFISSAWQYDIQYSINICLINIMVAVFPGNVAAFKPLSNTKYIRFEVRKPKSDFWHF